MVELPALTRLWTGAGPGIQHRSCGASLRWRSTLTESRVSPYGLSRFSERLTWSTPRNPYSLLLEQQRASGAALLDLTTSNPSAAFPDYPHQEIARAYGAIGSFAYEPEALGSWHARETIAAWYHEHGIHVAAEHIGVTASTSEAYAVLFKLLCNPGDEVLIPCPSYPLFEFLASAESIRTLPYQLNFDGSWFIDFASVEKSLSSRTKAVILVNPNNPTGSFLKADEANQLAALAKKHGFALISDEVFMTYPAMPEPAQQIRTLIGRDEIGRNDVLSFSLNGLSKAAGMPQMKLGWFVVNGPTADIRSALTKLELLLDNYLSVSTPVQVALPELLRIGTDIHHRIQMRVCQNRNFLARHFSENQVKLLESEGGWSGILQVPRIRSEEEWIAKLLTENKMVVQPGYFFDMAKEAFLVLSLLTNPLDLEEGVNRLKLALTNS